jgi:hypothetical protein
LRRLPNVAASIEQLGRERSVPTVKLRRGDPPSIRSPAGPRDRALIGLHLI